MDIYELHRRFPAAADYLLQIFIIERDYGTVTNQRLAERQGVSKPAVTQSVSRLRALEMVEQDRYGKIRLTSCGRELAAAVLERHYLIEHVLVHLLGYPWEKSDREAKELQEIISSDLTEHIRVRLGHPETCPHGNPFPGSPRERALIEAPRLSEVEEGETVSLVRITEEGEEIAGLLDFCDRHGLKPDTKLQLLAREVEGRAVRDAATGRRYHIPDDYARFFCIER